MQEGAANKTTEGASETVSMDAPPLTDPHLEGESDETTVALANDSATGQLLQMEADQPLHEEATGKAVLDRESDGLSDEKMSTGNSISESEGPSETGLAETVSGIMKQSAQKREDASVDDVQEGETKQKKDMTTSVFDPKIPDEDARDLEQDDTAMDSKTIDSATPDDSKGEGKYSETADKKGEHFDSEEDEPELYSEASFSESGDSAMEDEEASSRQGGLPRPHVSQNLTRLTVTSQFTEEDLYSPEKAIGRQPPEQSEQTTRSESDHQSLVESEKLSTKFEYLESRSPQVTGDLPSPGPYSAPSTSKLGKLLDSIPTPAGKVTDDPSSDDSAPAKDLSGSDLNMQMLSNSDVPKVFMCGEVLPTKPEKKSRIAPPPNLKGCGFKTKLKTAKCGTVRFSDQASSRKTTKGVSSSSSSDHTQMPKRSKYSPTSKVSKHGANISHGSTSVEIITPPDIDYSASKIFLRKTKTSAKKKQQSMKESCDTDYPTAHPLDISMKGSKVPMILEILPEAAESPEPATATEKSVKQHKIGSKRRCTALEEPGLPASATHEAHLGYLPSKAKKQKKTVSEFDKRTLRPRAKPLSQPMVPKSLDASPTDVIVSEPSSSHPPATTPKPSSSHPPATTPKPSSSHPPATAPKTQKSIGRIKKGKKGTVYMLF